MRAPAITGVLIFPCSQSNLRGALIVIMRSCRRWYKEIPELRGHSYELNSPQNVIVSPANCPKGYELIVAAIRNSCDGDGAQDRGVDL
jgi:hypothetical protein